MPPYSGGRCLKSDPAKPRFGSTQAPGRLACGHSGRKLKRDQNPNPLLSDWRCRSVSGRVAQAAILVALNRVRGRKEELLRKQGALREGELPRIDATLRRLMEQSSVSATSWSSATWTR